MAQERLFPVADEDVSEYRAELAGQISRIDQLWMDAEDPAKLRELVRALHSIAGAAGTFGFDRVGEIAAKVEALVGDCCERSVAPQPAERAMIDALIRELHNTAISG